MGTRAAPILVYACSKIQEEHLFADHSSLHVFLNKGGEGGPVVGTREMEMRRLSRSCFIICSVGRGNGRHSPCASNTPSQFTRLLAVMELNEHDKEEEEEAGQFSSLHGGMVSGSRQTLRSLMELEDREALLDQNRDADKDLRIAETATNLYPPVAPLPGLDDLTNELKTEIEHMKSQMSTYSATFAGLQMGRELGGGAFGTVYEAVTRSEKVAIKVLKADKVATLSEAEFCMNLNEFYGEALLLSMLNHPNILSFKFMISDVPSHGLPGMTTEFVSDDLFCFIRRAGGLKNWKNVWTIAKQVADGLKYLHSKKVVHFDIKSSNILVEYSRCPAPNILCKVADFGHAVENYRGVMRLNSKRGTMGYMAPEVIRASRTNMEVVTEKVDVYSYGILIWELIMGRLPHSGMPIEQMGPLVLKGLRPEVPNWCDDGWKSLMKACWSENQRQRPSLDQIVESFYSLRGAP